MGTTDNTYHQPSSLLVRKHLAEDVRELKTSSLGMSDYSIKAYERVAVAVEYYLDIYAQSLELAAELSGVKISDMTVVDYGGGHGLFSVYAKRMGAARVLYVDYNPEAVSAAGMLGDILGGGADVQITGDARDLREWCQTEEVTPHAVVGIDVIEHIYVLDDFFSAIHSISRQIAMVFTTASTPYNRFVVRRLHKAMVIDEQGDATHAGFRNLRRRYIAKQHPNLSKKDVEYWTRNTRGLTYKDIDLALEHQNPNLLLDLYNTCDPETGSWTERILPISDYRQLLAPYNWELTVLPGQYNEHRKGPKLWASYLINRIIRRGFIMSPRSLKGRRAYNKSLKLAPFIYLVVKAQTTDDKKK
ncbi:MAG: class I SAM-dependent methyltransferase [Bacteroidales bacterium]|nr:class I SAM-dependent methyltransferase [Bacteroidales bacterium]